MFRTTPFHSVLIAGFLLLAGLTATVATQASTSAEKHRQLIEYRDVPWVQAGNKTLTADIFVPDTGDKHYPVVLIYHGGGWLINDNSIMESTARYLAEHGGFVVANMNYRLLGDNHNTTTLDDIVEDALGGILWVKEHISQYKGDPERIAVTGDSAGGHLSAMVVLAANNLSSKPFTSDNLAFRPTYIPAGKTPEQIAENGEMEVQAAVFSYGAFDMDDRTQNGFESADNFFWQMAGAEPRGIFGRDFSVDTHPELYRAASPIHLIPDTRQRTLPPMFVHVGSRDTTTPPEAVRAFAEKLKSAGQRVEYKEYTGKNHAFLDTGCNEYLGNCFAADAPDTLDDMIRFIREQLE
ncbi:alpha/beta hydrolase [Microbulbifer hydrolyticus]|uniref:Acetyl esterase/lipase n=1 Tax=Microbulbifer hydrolyticus TaxID=48074 RepID=A0A6P1T5U0_9GAMM|nr:alpha/beta hydrolase [Microbulbifer hydrolyticus]MBB5211108.1 acetyl esterase/lipase [Microbulbifer hydrolyticus]QHQ38108.1 alpha/beta hydrolase fold domain-containing protein [Microbulbifer hydrolyticus]